LRLLGVPVLAAGLATGLLTTPPDAVAAADGRLFALHSGERMLLERRPGASRFTRELWLRSFGEVAAPDLPREGDVGRVTCAPAACLLQGEAGGGAILLLRPTIPRRGARPPPEPEPACTAVILSPEPLRAPCAESRVVDRFAIWQDGAHAVWLTPGGATVLSDRAHRGSRPWVPPRPLPRAHPSDEVPAEGE
jgi:competence protein ComEC